MKKRTFLKSLLAAPITFEAVASIPPKEAEKPLMLHLEAIIQSMKQQMPQIVSAEGNIALIAYTMSDGSTICVDYSDLLDSLKPQRE